VAIRRSCIEIITDYLCALGGSVIEELFPNLPAETSPENLRQMLEDSLLQVAHDLIIKNEFISVDPHRRSRSSSITSISSVSSSSPVPSLDFDPSDYKLDSSSTLTDDNDTTGNI
jgi:hypothetical protein